MLISYSLSKTPSGIDFLPPIKDSSWYFKWGLRDFIREYFDYMVATGNPKDNIKITGFAGPMKDIEEVEAAINFLTESGYIKVVNETELAITDDYYNFLLERCENGVPSNFSPF